jgi:TonB-dependent siderophore receptor
VSISRACFSISLLAFAAGLSAQSEAAGQDGAQAPEFEEEIYVEGTARTAALSASIAAAMDVALQQTPASVSVITRALSEEQGAVTLVDALRNVSGANVHTNLGVHDFFLVRGFDSLAGGVVLTDGIAEPEATFYHLYNVERVEVLKGPGSFLYGGNPLAGTVNLLRSEPASTSFWGVGVGGGSFETYSGNFDANWAAADGGVTVRVNGLWRESEGFRDVKDSRSVALNPVLDFALAPNQTLRLNIERMDNDYRPDAGLPVSGATSFDVPRERSYQSPFDYSEQEVTRLRLDWEGVSSGKLSLRNKLYYSELDWLSDGTLLNAVFPLPPAGDLYVFRSLVPLDDQQRFFGDRFEASLATRRHDYVFGLELSEQRDEFRIDVAELPPIALYDPVEFAAVRPDPIPGFTQAGDSERRIVAPFFLDRAMLSEQWQIFWGARLDVLDYEDALSGVEGDEEELSPLLGVVYAPSPRISAYLNAGRSFSPPSTRTGGALEPEQADQAELGVKGSLLGGKLQGTLSLYHIDRENMAIFDDNGFTAQTGNQRSQGVELELAGHVGALRYQIACAYNDSELVLFNEVVRLPPSFQPMVLDRSGNDPAFTPDQTWNFWIARTFSNGVGVGGGGRYVGRHYIAEDNVYRIGDALTLDASVFWNRDRWRFALNVKNFNDEDVDTRGFGATSFIPAAGASAQLSVDYRM